MSGGSKPGRKFMSINGTASDKKLLFYIGWLGEATLKRCYWIRDLWIESELSMYLAVV